MEKDVKTQLISVLVSERSDMIIGATVAIQARSKYVTIASSKASATTLYLTRVARVAGSGRDAVSKLIGGGMS